MIYIFKVGINEPINVINQPLPVTEAPVEDESKNKLNSVLNLWG